LTPDRQIDFFRYIEETYYNNPQIQTDDNGFRIFVRTFGNVFESANARPYYIRQKYQKLGLDVKIPPIKVFPESPAKIILLHNSSLAKTKLSDITKMLDKPWTLDDFPELSDWIKSANEPLDEAAEMIRKPIFVCPLLIYSQSIVNPSPLICLSWQYFFDFLEIARLYSARANYRIAKGDIDGAVNDTITIYQLGQHIAKDVNVLDVALIAISIKEIAHNIPLDANPNHPLTKEQSRRLLDTINQLPPRAETSALFEFARLIVLDSTQTTLRTGNFDWIGADTKNPAYKFAPNFNLCNKNMIFYRVNEAFDIAIGKKQGNIYEYNAKLYYNTVFVKRLFTSSGRGMIIADCIIPLMMQSFDLVEKTIKRDDSLLNLKRLTLALHIYKAEHGEFPKADWIEKIKPYLGDNFEKYLHCPACSNQEKGKTNYALILYDKMPENKKALQLIELNFPVPYDQAAITVEETLKEFNKYVSKSEAIAHSKKINAARQNGAVLNIRVNDIDSEKKQVLYGQEPEE
jgi:hypothetical protein